jgi:hypothetical protein
MRIRNDKRKASMTTELAIMAKVTSVPIANNTRILGQLRQDVKTRMAETSLPSDEEAGCEGKCIV